MMASGQQCLADLLGITNLATQSLSTMMMTDQSAWGDNKDIPENTLSKGQCEDKHIITGLKDKKKEKRDEGQTDITQLSDLSSVSLDDVFDKSRSTEVMMPKRFLREIQQDNSVDPTVQTEAMSSTGSAERLPTPEPSDFVKPGVFVSSGCQKPFIDQAPLKDKETQPQLQGCRQPTVNVSSALMQGKENMNMKQDTPEQEGKEMLVLKYPQGQKKSILQEKFKTRMRNNAPVKKTVIPKMISSEKAKQRIASAVEELEPGPSKRPEAVTSISADEAVSYAAVATSTAITPFLQIQNALENTISSLVTTMNLAHDAEDKFKTRIQEKKYEELEGKIMEILDKRVTRSEHLDQKKGKRDQQALEKAASSKYPVGSEVSVLARDHRMDTANIHPPLESKTNPGFNNFDSDLQMIPTRDKDGFKKTSSPISWNPISGIPNVDAVVPGFTSSGGQNPSRDIPTRPTAIPRSYPTPAKYFDKSTSPGLNFAHFKHAKTQTSSSESSILSEKSLLDTPLPRSKIPIPFSRYTPKDKDSYKYKMKRSENRNELLRKILKEDRQAVKMDKENVSPSKHTQKPSTRETRHQDKMDSGDNETIRPEETKISLDEPFKGMKDDIIPAKEFDNFNDKIAPIDRYLVYPLRNAHQQETNRPPATIDGNEIPGRSKDGDRADATKGQSARAENATGNKTEGHYVAASRILSEIQQRRERLESNLGTLVRQRNQQRVYDYVDQHESDQGGDIQRIRFDVDKKIDEICAQLQKEIYTSSKQNDQKAQVNEKQKKRVTQKPVQREVGRGTKQKSKENPQLKSTKAKKSVEPKEKPKRKPGTKTSESANISQSHAVIRPSHYDPDLLASLFGQRVEKPHRYSVRPPHIQFHSPPKPSTAARRGRAPNIDPPSHKKAVVAEAKANKQHEIEANEPIKAKYYFQPSDPQFHVEADTFQFPSSGDLVPVAKPLGKPRQDEKLRLPIPSQDSALPRDNSLSRTAMQSNVALVDVISDTPRESKAKKKRNGNLVVQNLPSVDIEALQETSESPRDKKTPNKEVTFTPPRVEDYEEFQNYVACVDVIEEEKQVDENDDGKPLEFKGVEEEQPREYNEPRFPPERPHCEAQSTRAEILYKTSLEDKAQEWIEHELLARIVSQMSIPQDPVAIPHDDDDDDDDDESIESDDVEEGEGEEGDWIHEILGLGGVQLCIDAGIPVNKQLIEDLVKDVVAEKIVSLLGYPKHSKTPVKTVAHEQEHLSEIPSNVLTPLATPVYTPVDSEASNVHTPESSCCTEEASQEEFDHVEEELKEIDIIETEPTQRAEDSVIIPTPPRTPLISSSPVDASIRHETPVPSSKEDQAQPSHVSQVGTPQLSSVDETIRTVDDFASTTTLKSESEDEAPPQSPHRSPRTPIPLSPQHLVQVIPKAASVQSSSFTVSSSTTVGTSMFEGISEGEKLCPDYIIPGLYSEGEFPISDGQDVQLLLDHEEGDMGPNFKVLLQNVIGQKTKGETVIDGNGSATLKDTEELEEDTLEEVSISEGEILAEHDPMVKLLNQIRSPPVARAKLDGAVQSDKEKSEGEISRGEELETKQMYNSFAQNGSKRDVDPGIRQRVLSAGEIIANNGNGSRVQSYSLGEVRDSSLTDADFSSNREEPLRFRGDVKPAGVLVNQRRLEVDTKRHGSARTGATEPSARNLVKGNQRIDKSFETDSINTIEPENDQDGNGDTLERPRTILVQSGNFETASTFNFTDSLNEQKLDSFHEQDILDAIDEHPPDSVSREESYVDGFFSKKESDNKQPTKITLTIPSVVDEDSADELTLEGDDLYSNEDVSNISL